MDTNINPLGPNRAETSHPMMEEQWAQQAIFERHLSEPQQSRRRQAGAGSSRRILSADQADPTDMATQGRHMNLVLVSNRVADGKPNEPATGGLAAALLPVVEDSGAVWMGSSGDPSQNSGDPSQNKASVHELGNGALVKLELPEAEYAGYYDGFANSTLWPALHSLSERISVSNSDRNYESYHTINEIMANALLKFGDRDAFWVHDYQLLVLGAKLREKAIDRPIGFFLHTPWPGPDVWQRVPHHDELIESMMAYDLLGFHTERDCRNFLDCVHSDLGLRSKDGVVASNRGLTRCKVFPIGIDADQFARYAAASTSDSKVASLRSGLNGEKLAVGVDRLDYTKGLHERIEAFDQLCTERPGSISLLQVATPTRAKIEMYQKYRDRFVELVEDANARHATDDWIPIRHQDEGVSQKVLAGLYRAAHVAVVTPIRDGMNLVVKEYVAAQDPNDPGVPVLSKYAGAADELKEALLVDPKDIPGIKRAILEAMEMPLAERCSRWKAMMKTLRENSLQNWSANFVRELENSRFVARVPPNRLDNIGLGRTAETQFPSEVLERARDVLMRPLSRTPPPTAFEQSTSSYLGGQSDPADSEYDAEASSRASPTR
ncbi:trehalose-6-phosphate synthase [Bradyrhizobium sp. CCGUVB4N]|uniref:alpha,alpha-trehalose-phosphate synthase (UDP-forming) n=1 Tax=Bradyrhizobium sp. CCGUVB4N TaxID=2949631 RepID=UPI0020B189AE|nr:trehalose-6-phosphate synthase [Bradyrhizobium sp. CCGUVB4N]MCP3380100.1 trehalose-6-phosphate synthase [Bradyrhizobium sp. CCGUVB4N]